MQRGKYKCKQLKAIRKRIADENGIPLEQRECTYEGPCRGTCPHCEAEVRYIEKALTERIRLGRVATVAGLSLGLAACGGETPREVSNILTTDSSLKIDTLPVVDTTLPVADSTVPDENTVCPEVTTMGLIIATDDETPPPEILDEEGKINIVDVIIKEDDTEDDTEGEVRPFVVVEQEPEFPGGMDSLYAWIVRNLSYPEQARKEKITGKVFVTFVVEKDGSITTPKILRDIGGGCGAEAIRVVKNMPRWNPGKQRGKPVRVQFNLPINFSLK